MANENPKGRGAAVALKLPVDHVRFLRDVFEQAHDGVRDELREYPESLKDPERLRREDAAYGLLLTSLDEPVIVPSPDVLAILADLATMIDAGNEHARVVTEHEALNGLLDQLTEGRDPVIGRAHDTAPQVRPKALER
jgi:hypothetical protein